MDSEEIYYNILKIFKENISLWYQMLLQYLPRYKVHSNWTSRDIIEYHLIEYTLWLQQGCQTWDCQ